MVNIRKRAWEIVEVAKPGDLPSRVFDIAILVLIFLNVVAVIVESLEAFQLKWGIYLNLFELVSIIIFTVEYAVRIWSCTTEFSYKRPILGRLRFATKTMSIIDLLAILPFYLPFLGVDLRTFRVIRLMRIVRVAKLGRYYSSLKLIQDVLKSKKEELILTSSLMFLLLVISSSLLYFCENPVQPEVFSSIPATMWWSIATLTTVGYGDMYPITFLGKFWASIVAILGIGMFALPTGIIGAGFVEAIQQSKGNKVCPHCGEIVP